MADEVAGAGPPGRLAVVRFPGYVDASNAGQVRDELLAAIGGGAAVVVADMSATVSCDQTGDDALARAYQRAAVSGTVLRLAASGEAVRRLVSDEGLDRLVAVYPSLRAAVAAGVPDGQIRPGTSAPESWQPASAAGPPPGNGDGQRPAAVNDVVLRQLIDALDDGIALTDHEGTIVLASRQLAAMFGYDTGELAGRGVDTLVPAGLRDAHRADRAAYLLHPVSRPMSDRARLAGLRKDGGTIPVSVTLSPVPTASGHLILAVVRDTAQARRREDLAELARAAAAEQARHSQELLDRVVGSLFHVGLSLQAAQALPTDVARNRITGALQRLDDTIHEIRDHVLGSHGPAGGAGPAQ